MARLHPQGTFCWLELATTDPAAAGRFYGRLFGWKTFHTEMPGGGTYTFLRQGQGDVGAVYEEDVDEQLAGRPPSWLPYVAVDDCPSAVARARGLGATVLAGPLEVPEAGTLAVLQDPDGATLGLFQAAGHPGFADLGQAPGAPVWFEVLTRDVTAMQRFYGGFFDWKARTAPLAEGGEYTELLLGDTSVAGMMAMPEGLEGVPASWLTYFRVEDLDAAVRTAEGEGGSVNVAAQRVEGVGRFAVLTDPQGAVFALIEPPR